MGWFGLMWMSEEIAKLEALKGMLKDEEQIEAIDDIIDDLKVKQEEKEKEDDDINDDTDED